MKIIEVANYVNMPGTVAIIASALMAERERERDRCAGKCIRLSDEASAPAKGDFTRADAFLTTSPSIRKGENHDAD